MAQKSKQYILLLLFFAVVSSPLYTDHLSVNDIQLQKMKIDTVYLLLEWNRIEPEEHTEDLVFDQTIIDHYKDVCKTLKEHGTEPVVIVYNYQSEPLWFTEKGGFAKEENVIYFLRYCNRMFQELGNVATYWVSFWNADKYFLDHILLHTKNILNAHITAHQLKPEHTKLNIIPAPPTICYDVIP